MLIVSRGIPRSLTILAILWVVICPWLPGSLAAQVASPVPSPAVDAGADTVRDHYRRQEIETSTLQELAAALRGLGLSDQGTLAELKQRLLAYYKLDQTPSGNQVVNPAPDASPSPLPSPSSAGKKPLDVRIESAGSAKYFTVEEVDEDYLRLSGGVALLVTDSDKNTTHRISAERIMYNRKQDTMIAQGDVNYKLTENGKDQQFFGSEMRFSLTNMEVFLLDGVLYNKHSVETASLNFRIEGDEIGRVDRNLSVIDKAVVSSSQAVPPSYRVSAGHIWVLQSGEWAVREGVLYVGRVPVMYFPFFYYPSDELFFHPVAGYQEPEGAFIQTTTYLLGQKPKSEAPLSFMQFDEGNNSGTTTKAHGLWLERIAKPSAPAVSPSPSASPNPESNAGSATANPGLATGDYLKLLIDAYSRFGYLTGFQGKITLPSVGSLDFITAAGFSRNLYNGAETGSVSTYYFSAGQAEKEYWDSGYIFGTVLPFRFLLDLKANLNISGYELGLSLPLSSDPIFRSDFMTNRKEDIDWAKLIGLEKTSTTTTTTQNSADQTMTMSLTNRWTPDLAFLKPFVDSFSLSKLDASIGWSVRTWTTPVPEVAKAIRTANKQFWAPQQMTMPDLGLTISGTILQYPWVRPTSPTTKSPNADPPKTPDGSVATGTDSTPVETKVTPVFLFPETEYEPPLTEEEKKKVGEKPGPQADDDLLQSDQLAVVEAQGVVASSFKLNDWQAKLSYAMTPGLTVNSRFAAADSIDPLSIPLEQNYWTLQDRLSGNVHLTAATPLNLFSLDGIINLSGQEQSILASDPTSPVAIITNIQTSTAKAKFLTIDNIDVVKFSPLTGINYVDTSSLEYRLSTVWYRYKWDTGDTVDSATYKTETVEFFTGKSKDFITEHYAGLNLGFVTTPFTAHLSGKYTLPPLAQSIVGHADIGVFSNKATVSADETFNIADDNSKITPAPLKLALNLSLIDWFSTNHNLEYDVENDKFTNYNGSINFFGFVGSLQAKWATDQVFSPTTHAWVASGEESFRIVSSSLDYSINLEPDPFWYNRMKTKLSLSGRWSQNFITVTDSSLSWNLAWKYSVAEFLDFDFTVKGQNNRLFRYIPESNKLLGLPNDRNFFTDLLQSFNFTDEAKRQGSYFKMSSIVVNASHYLGDWKLTVGYTGTPEVKTINLVQKMIWTYQFSAYIAWIPIPEIKSTIKANKDPADATYTKDVLTIE